MSENVCQKNQFAFIKNLYSIVYTVYFKYCKVLVVATGRIREEYKQELTLPSPMCISQNWKEN